MKKKKSQKEIEHKRLYVCPRCLDYHYSVRRICTKCGCVKCYTSVLRSIPKSLSKIPKEDWKRIIDYKKLNGYNYTEYLEVYRCAPLLGVCVPRDDKPSYVMKGLAKPKAQTGGFGGIANHAGISGNIRTINGGSCTPK